MPLTDNVIIWIGVARTLGKDTLVMKPAWESKWRYLLFAGILTASALGINLRANAGSPPGGGGGGGEDIIFNADLTAYATLACDNTVGIDVDISAPSDPEPDTANTFDCTITTNYQKVGGGADLNLKVTADTQTSFADNDDTFDLLGANTSQIIHAVMDANAGTDAILTSVGSTLSYADSGNKDWFDGVNIDVATSDVNLDMTITTAVQLVDDANLDAAGADTYSDTVTFTISML